MSRGAVDVIIVRVWRFAQAAFCPTPNPHPIGPMRGILNKSGIAPLLFVTLTTATAFGGQPAKAPPSPDEPAKSVPTEAPKPPAKAPTKLGAKKSAKAPVKEIEKKPAKETEKDPTKAATKKADEASEAPAKTAGDGAERSMEALRAEKERLELEHALESQKQESALAELESKKRAIRAKLDLDAAERDLELSRLEAETGRITAERHAAEQELALQQAKLKLARAAIDGDMELVEARRAARKRVSVDVAHRDQPFEKGVLYVSDRRIPLNGPITMETADEVTQRLHFFNNQNAKDPIFIVIDYSPGGSVMAGYRILKAMEASESPVHVVVKSFAASMAAVITTRAEHSYAYPNALILHHQISSGTAGNLTQQAEHLKDVIEWSRRLLGPVHKKMGISHDELVKRMYQHDSDGDWKEFADEAVKLKWVDHVVNDVRETGMVDLDDAPKGSSAALRAHEEKDAEGKVFNRLPRLLPSDHWFLHNPDGYYR